MKQGEKRDGRISTLFDRAIKGKYTSGGKFSYTELVLDAQEIGVSKATAKDYADEVIERLQLRGHLK